MRLSVGIALLAVLTVAGSIWVHRWGRRRDYGRTLVEKNLREANQRLSGELDSQSVELAELSQHLIRAAEEEKARIARDLHDTFGSNLTAINMDLNWIGKRLPAQHAELHERLQRTLRLVAATADLKDEVIQGLRPSHLDHLGLAHALRELGQDFEGRTGVACRVEIAEEFHDLDPAWSIALYRVAQEAFTNIAKHAHASTVQLQLRRESNGIRLRVADDGVGMTETNARRLSHGLIGMHARMRQIGGLIHVGSVPIGTGTVVDAFVMSSKQDTMSGKQDEGFSVI